MTSALNWSWFSNSRYLQWSQSMLMGTIVVSDQQVPVFSIVCSVKTSSANASTLYMLGPACWALVPHTSHTSRVQYQWLHSYVCLRMMHVHEHFIHLDVYFTNNISMHHIIATIIVHNHNIGSHTFALLQINTYT